MYVWCMWWVCLYATRSERTKEILHYLNYVSCSVAPVLHLINMNMLNMTREREDGRGDTFMHHCYDAAQQVPSFDLRMSIKLSQKTKCNEQHHMHQKEMQEDVTSFFLSLPSGVQVYLGYSTYIQEYVYK